jgi:hypothetical protein
MEWKSSPFIPVPNKVLDPHTKRWKSLVPKSTPPVHGLHVFEVEHAVMTALHSTLHTTVLTKTTEQAQATYNDICNITTQHSTDDFNNINRRY